MIFASLYLILALFVSKSLEEIVLTAEEIALFKKPISAQDKNEIQFLDQYWFFSSPEEHIQKFIQDKSKNHYILHMIREYKDRLNEVLNFPVNRMIFFQKIISEGPSVALIELMDPRYNLTFDFTFISGSTVVFPSIENNGHGVDISYLTPLMLAIVSGNVRNVELLTRTALKRGLGFDTYHRNPRINLKARDVARKIKNKELRHKILKLLKIDPVIHKVLDNLRILKFDTKITVKEAVMLNSYEVVNAALTRGNFGDMNNVHIVRRAIMNNNEEIVEALVLEGYKVPVGSEIPTNTTITQSRLALLLSGNPIFKPKGSKYSLLPM